jgi:uncharacterized Zn-binding protein involved in type VI secretion
MRFFPNDYLLLLDYVASTFFEGINMPKAARVSDIGSGHGCFPATNIVAGSPNVFIENLPAARVGDPLAAHGCATCTPHGRGVASGSSTVFINGLAAARVGDSINCGGVISTGSGTVFIGG